MMTMLKALIKYFSKSSYVTTLLWQQRNLVGDDKPVNALQKIGKTHFRTHWMAVNALDPCLSSIQSLVLAGKIEFKVFKPLK
jgi:hypothetical protein